MSQERTFFAVLIVLIFIAGTVISYSDADRSEVRRDSQSTKAGERTPERNASIQGNIAFVSVRSGNWDLYIVKADGTGLRQLTRTPVDERSPAWSPDGKRIAYATNDGNLWTMELDAAEAEVIPLKTEGSEVRRDSQSTKSDQKLEVNTHPCWSPGGKSIAFTSYQDPKLDDSDIWMVDIDGGNLERLVLQKDIQVDPAWSPDGKVLIYSSAVYGPFYKIIQDLWVMEFYGRKASRLLVNDAANVQPEWSPDGSKIAFASNSTGNMDIWILSFGYRVGRSMNADGKALKQLTRNEAYDADPTWSPDGKHLAFVSNRSGSMQIWVIDASGNNPKQLTQEGQSKDPSWGI